MSKFNLQSIKRKWKISWHHDRLKHEPNPFRDWKTILSIGVVLFSLVLVVQGYIYFYYIYTEPQVQSLSSLDGIHDVIDLPKLQRVVGLINTRQLEFEALLNKKPYAADPYR